MSMEEQVPVSLSYWQDVRKRFFGNKISIVGLVILVSSPELLDQSLVVGSMTSSVQIFWLAQEAMVTG
jgi:hypothetical protein